MSNRFSSCLKGKLGPERLSVDGHIAPFDFNVKEVRPAFGNVHK